MRILYWDCSMGAAGDMLTGSLLDLLDTPEVFRQEFNALGIPGVEMTAQSVQKCGIFGTKVQILVHGEEEGPSHSSDCHHEHHHGHHHASLQDITSLIDGLPLPPSVKSDATAVYGLIAEAEAKVHGTTPSEIHFHEVGTLDAVADVVACSMLVNQLQPELICASPVRVGFGQVHCAHGVLPVPAPAAALLLRGIPTYGGDLEGEFCTPTGAALLRHFAGRFGPQPLMASESIGYGMGSRDFPTANCVRAIFGHTTA